MSSPNSTHPGGDLLLLQVPWAPYNPRKWHSRQDALQKHSKTLGLATNSLLNRPLALYFHKDNIPEKLKRCDVLKHFHRVKEHD